MLSPGPSRFHDLDEVCQTTYRAWGGADVQNAKGSGPVAGLRDVLADAGMSSFTAVVEDWCATEGAVFLAELLDEVDGLCGALGLQQLERLRLHTALEHKCAQARGGDVRRAGPALVRTE